MEGLSRKLIRLGSRTRPTKRAFCSFAVGIVEIRVTTIVREYLAGSNSSLVYLDEPYELP